MSEPQLLINTGGVPNPITICFYYMQTYLWYQIQTELPDLRWGGDSAIQQRQLYIGNHFISWCQRYERGDNDSAKATCNHYISCQDFKVLLQEWSGNDMTLIWQGIVENWLWWWEADHGDHKTIRWRQLTFMMMIIDQTCSSSTSMLW